MLSHFLPECLAGECIPESNDITNALNAEKLASNHSELRQELEKGRKISHVSK